MLDALQVFFPKKTHTQTIDLLSSTQVVCRLKRPHFTVAKNTQKDIYCREMPVPHVYAFYRLCSSIALR